MSVPETWHCLLLPYTAVWISHSRDDNLNESHDRAKLSSPISSPESSRLANDSALKHPWNNKAATAIFMSFQRVGAGCPFMPQIQIWFVSREGGGR